MEQIPEQRDCFLPENTEEKKIDVKKEQSYQAFDGRIFQTKEECENYEKHKEITDNRTLLLIGIGLVIGVLLLLNFIKLNG